MDVRFTYVQSTVREIFVIYTVGHLLGFKAKHILLSLRIAALKWMVGIAHKVARIELNAGLVGVNLHYSAAFRLINASTRFCHRVFSLYEIDTVIKAARQTERLVRKIEILSD